MTQDFPETPPVNRGDAFQETVAAWLSRPVPERGQNQCFDLPAILATDIGLQRNENQDRIAALRFSPKQGGSQPITAVIIADGMGGMRDGAKCATLAVSSFFYALVRHRHQGLEQRGAAAVLHANNAVYAFAGGRGGATLSAVVFDWKALPVIINLGDSRIYSCGKGVKVERLTVDDSLEEAVGGHGRELLQFVGMGAGIQPHIRTVPSEVTELALTTDGIHYIEPATLENILFHAPEPKFAAERLSALARWCGGHDNASMAVVDLRALLSLAPQKQDGGIQVWDPFGALTLAWIRDFNDAPRPPAVASPAIVHPEPQIEKRSADPKERKSARRPPKKGGRARGQSSAKEDIQLEIQIEKSAEPKDGDDDSR